MVWSDYLKICLRTTISGLRVCKNFAKTKMIEQIPRKTSECIVIGTGPSFEVFLSSNRDFVLSKEKLCVNDIALLSIFTELQPAYYTVFDPAYFDDTASTHFINMRNDLFRCIVQKTKWPMILFLPWQARNFARKNILGNNSNVRIMFVNNTIVDGFEGFRHLMYRLNLGMPRVQNVLVAGIFLMLNMGYKNIYIIGADHSWHEDIILDNDNRLCLKLAHSYDNTELKYVPFFKDAQEKQTFTMHELFNALSETFKGYAYLRKYADYRGASIINASGKTYIDAFERLKL